MIRSLSVTNVKTLKYCTVRIFFVAFWVFLHRIKVNSSVTDAAAKWLTSVMRRCCPWTAMQRNTLSVCCFQIDMRLDAAAAGGYIPPLHIMLMFCYLAIFFPRSKSAADMSFLFIYLKQPLHLRVQHRVFLFQSLADVLMYGCIDREWRKTGIFRVLRRYYSTTFD